MPSIVLALTGAGCFYAGVVYERQHGPATVAMVAPRGQGPHAVQTAAVAAPAAAQPSHWPEAMMETRRVDGLDVQTLDVARDNADASQLHYEFEVANDGRPYEGTLEFLVLGRKDGQEVSWVYPPENQRNGKAFQMRVARYLKLGGDIPLPADLTPYAVELRLRESTGIRASRSIVLAGAEADKLPQIAQSLH